MKKFALVGLAGALAAVGIAAPSIAGGNKYASETNSRVCEGATDGGTITLVGPEKLWPPNHKLVDETVTATADSGDGEVTLTLTPAVDDAVGGDGGSQHDPDVAFTNGEGQTFTKTETDGDVEAGMQLRAERSGKGEGRTYTINWSADFNGNPCSSEDEGQSPFVIEVPHDMRGGADWK